MGLPLSVLLILGALPFLLVVFHGFLARLLKLAGIDPGPQLTAIMIVPLLNGGIAILMSVYGGALWPEDGTRRWFDVGYILLTANALWFVYFQVFVNLSLTSLHARLMLEALWKGSVEPQSLASEYDSQTLLSARLDRLRKLRQIAIGADMISLEWPYLLWLSYPLYWWRRLIRMEGERLNLTNLKAAATRSPIN
jgi:hypothetical protein